MPLFPSTPDGTTEDWSKMVAGAASVAPVLIDKSAVREASATHSSSELLLLSMARGSSSSPFAGSSSSPFARTGGALSQAVAPLLREDPRQYRSPHRRTSVFIKVTGHNPEDVPAGFAQRLQEGMAALGTCAVRSVMWAGCIALRMELDRPSFPALHTSSLLSAAAAADPLDPLPAGGGSGADAAILKALLSTLAVAFADGQQVVAEVDGRRYFATLGHAADAASAAQAENGPAWTLQLLDAAAQQSAAAAAAAASWAQLATPPPAVCAASARVDFAAQTCVMLGPSREAPFTVRLAGRGLAAVGVSFAAMVQGRFQRCTHRVLRRAPPPPLVRGGAGAAAAAAAPHGAPHCCVDVCVPALGPLSGPGLLLIECQAAPPASAAAAGSPGGQPPAMVVAVSGQAAVTMVAPVLVLDDPWVAMEVGELLQEAQACASAGDAEGMAAIHSFLWDLGAWLDFVHRRQTAPPPTPLPLVAPQQLPGGRCVEAAAAAAAAAASEGAFMQETGVALLAHVHDRGWGSTTQRIASGLASLAPPPPPGVVASLLRRAALAFSAASRLLGGVFGRSAAPPMSPPPPPPHLPTRLPPPPLSPRSAARAGVLRAMLFGFDAPVDEARYVRLVGQATSALAKAWTLLAAVFVVALLVRIVHFRVWGNLFVAAIGGVPIYAAAWCVLRAVPHPSPPTPAPLQPSQLLPLQQQGRPWVGAVASRVASHALVAAGVPLLHLLLDLLEAAGDGLGPAMPTLEESVWVRQSIWGHALYVLANAGQHHWRTGGAPAQRPLSACLGAATLRGLLGVAFVAVIEFWSRHAFLRASRRKGA